MTSYRIDRVNKELLREMSEIVQRHLKNETAKEAIFTAVECSKDLENVQEDVPDEEADSDVHGQDD